MWRDALTRRFPRLVRVPRGAYAAGGAIRDILRAIEPDDVDIAAPDPLAAAEALALKVIRLGKDELIAFRVVEGDHVYDFSELRGGDINVDLARRDFTINAMAVSLDDWTLLDPFDGAADIAARLIRMIDPKNFDDDPLRMLRGVRIAVEHRFTIEPATIEAIRARAASITTVAEERIAFELSAIFSANAFRTALSLLHATGLDVPMFGEELNASRFHADDVSLVGAFTLLPPGEGAPKGRMRGEIETLKHLIDNHTREALYDATEPIARQLPAVLRALGRDDTLDWPDFATMPLLDGNEIATLANVEPGPALGRIKRALLEAQLRGEVRTREEAEQFVRHA